jgi:ribonucleoside-diphosphate reductase beta chain
MTNWSVFDSTSRANHVKASAFLDANGGVTIQRFDVMKYRQFDKLTNTQLGFFWRPEEVELVKDGIDFKRLTDHERHIFTANLKRQILLDSVQGRSPNIAFLPIVSLPELEAWIQTWAFSETIHSRSYTHIIRNVYANPSKIFDDMAAVDEIAACAEDITKHYDELIRLSSWYRLLGEGRHKVNGEDIHISLYALKKALWLTLMSVNILEGVRFYISFACSFAFAELKKMEGNAKIIKFVCRDENLHLAGTQMMLKLLVKEDADYVRIAHETRDECINLYLDAIKQEKAWAHYLFANGSMIGLNEQLLSEYIDYIANKRIVAVGLPSLSPKITSNPLPWTQKWIAGSDVQVAPQESEIVSYIVGGTKQDVDQNTFKAFSL